jgi:hypothetical protein
MKRETPVLLSLASLTWLALAPSGAAFAQAQQPQYPPAQYPPAQYPQQPQYPAPRPAPQQPTPTPAYPPGYPAPQYPQQPAYPPGYPPRPAAPPQAPAPQYPPATPQAPPPGYPAPQYPPQAPGYPQQPPGQPPQYPQQPGYPPQYPQQPGYPPQAGYPPGYPQPGYDTVAGALRPGAQEHTGFYIRLLGGPNYLNTGWSLNGTKLAYSGFGAFLSAAVGAAVAENFIMYGEASTYSLLSGSGKLNRADGTTVEADNEDNLYTIGAGPGAAYYIMPLNLYVGGSLQVTFLRGDLVKETNGDKPDVGLAFNADAGKEFFVTDDWGVGANLRLSYMRNGLNTGGLSLTYNTIVAALCFSATFN